jgi:hypothetical protein
MNCAENPQLDVRLVPSLENAIDRWLAARKNAKMVPCDQNEQAYNATWFALGEAWAEWYSEATDAPGAFERFRRGLISPEADE